MQTVDLNDDEAGESGSQQAFRVAHVKKKTLEEIKSLVGAEDGSTVSFVIVGNKFGRYG